MLLIVSIPSPTSASTPLVLWDFNETGVNHLDSLGTGITAVSGNEVINTGTSINMPYVADWKTSFRPGRLTRANDIRLNPDSGDFAVTVRYKTTRSWGNLIQKGQNGARGGYFKVELPEGRVTCLFKDALGVQRSVRSPQAINDGQYHVMRCERTSTGIAVYIDGVRAARTSNNVGNVSNTVELTIAGKGKCTNLPNQTSCDYFVGEIDYVQIDKG